MSPEQQGRMEKLLGQLSGVSTTLLTAEIATGEWVSWAGGAATWQVWGTWNGATAQLQSSPDGGTTAINADGVSATVNSGFRGLPLEAGIYRVLITGAGGSTSLSSSLTRSG